MRKSVRRSLFGIMTLCRVMPNSDPEGWMFLSASYNHDIFFFSCIPFGPRQANLVLIDYASSEGSGEQ